MTMTTAEMSRLWHEPLANSSFDAIENLRDNRKHIHAFILLAELDPWPNERGTYDNCIACAEHDEVWLGFSDVHVANVITPEQVVELRRCGVFYNDDGMGFHLNI